MYLLGFCYAVLLVLVVKNTYYYLQKEDQQRLLPDQEEPPVNSTLAYDYCQAGKLSSFTYKPLEKAELLKVQVLIRHGDRTPEVAALAYDNQSWDCKPVHGFGYSGLEEASRQYLGTMEVENYVKVPESLFKGNYFWKGSCDLGQLTPKGATQQVQLGKALREIYVKKLAFLPQELPRSQDKQNGLMAIRSTDFKRTQQSARFLMTGLYPSSSLSRQQKQPLRVAIYPGKLETMRPSTYPKFNLCPRLTQLLADFEISPEMREFRNSTTALRLRLLQRMNATTSMDLKGESVKNFFDTLLPRHCHGFPLPCHNDKECVTRMDMEELLQAGLRENWLRFGGTPLSQEITKLSSTLFLQELKTSILATIANSKSAAAVIPKFELYAGHDTTLSSLLSVLRIKELLWPPYASNLIIELWRLKNKKGHLIRIWYNGKALKTDWCNFGEGCKLEDFLSFLLQNTPQDFEAACESL